MMKYKKFDNKSGLYVSELILGGAMFGTAKGYGADKEEAVKILSAYADAGGNFIDTSDAYQLGESESIIGDFLKGKRDEFVLSSKYTRSAFSDPAISLLGNNRKAMISSVEASLKRLKTDRIDIYIAHFDDHITPAEELARGFEDLVRAGKIIYGGLSNFPAWKMAKAIQTSNILRQAPIIALQTEYSLVQRVPDREILPMAKDFELGIMAYSPLAGGLLTGKYRQNETGRISRKNDGSIGDARNEAILDALVNIGIKVKASPANVAVAWLLSKGIHPVIGPRTLEHLKGYLASVNTILSDDLLIILDNVSKIALEYPHDLNSQQRELLLSGKIRA